MPERKARSKQSQRQMLQRFFDMRDEKLIALAEYHEKYAQVIREVLAERQNERRAQAMRPGAGRPPGAL